MKAYIGDDELVVTATIPAAAGKKVTITALPDEVRYPFIEANFDEAGVLVHESWPVGVVLRCGSERVVGRGARGSIVDAMYRFTFDDPALNFTVRLPGVGGGVVDVNDLGEYDGERAYAFPVASFSDIDSFVDVPDLDPEPEIPTFGKSKIGVGKIVTFRGTAGMTTWSHAPADTDNYMLLFIAVSIPVDIPAGELWTNVIKFNSVELPRLGRVLTSGDSGAATDKTRGYIEVYGGPITAGLGAKNVLIQLSAQYGVPAGSTGTYTLRGNSVTFTNGVPGAVIVKDGLTASDNSTVSLPAGNTVNAGSRLIGASFCATTPASQKLTGSLGEGSPDVLWLNSVAGTGGTGMPFIIFEEDGRAPASTNTVVAKNTGSDHYFSGVLAVNVSPDR